MKKASKSTIIILMASILLCSCTANLNKKNEVSEDTYEDRYEVIDKGPVKGKSIRLFSTPIDTLNPITTNNKYVQDFLGLIYEGLYTLDSSQTPVSVLAKSSMLSSDGMTLTVYLKEDINWQDKMPFKPEDVVFTINTIMDKNNNSIYIKNISNIASAMVGENNSVVIKLKKPYSFMKYELTFPILPLHHFLNEKINDKQSKANLTPIGTGPYSFLAYTPSASVKLKLNEEWWNKDGNRGEVESTKQGLKAKSEISLPYITNIEVKIYPNYSNADTAFQEKQLSVISADYADFRKYIGRTDISMKRFAGRNYEFISLNMKKGPLADKNVRNALSNFIDKKKLVDSVVSGIAVTADIPVLPNSWVYQLTDLKKTNDLSKAKELMIKSGYTFDPGKAKYLRKYTKQPLTLKLLVNEENSLRYTVASGIASQLNKNGINVDIVKLPWEETKKYLKNGAYDMALVGYKISSIPDLSFAYSSTEINSGLNVAQYSEPEVDMLLQSILIENNLETQKILYSRLFKKIYEDIPYIGLFFLDESMMFSKNVRGEVNPYAWNRYNDISRWYVP